jgi:hypothetical protein
MNHYLQARHEAYGAELAKDAPLWGGAVPWEEMKEINAFIIRTAWLPTAPPEGIFLWRVWY